MMQFIAGLAVIFTILGLGALTGTFVAWGYNVALAEPFGWPTLLWWQGWIILILSGLLLRGLRSK